MAILLVFLPLTFWNLLEASITGSNRDLKKKTQFFFYVLYWAMISQYSLYKIGLRLQYICLRQSTIMYSRHIEFQYPKTMLERSLLEKAAVNGTGYTEPSGLLGFGCMSCMDPTNCEMFRNHDLSKMIRQQYSCRRHNCDISNNTLGNHVLSLNYHGFAWDTFVFC